MCPRWRVQVCLWAVLVTLSLGAIDTAGAAEVISVRTDAVDLRSPYVPVSLNAYANDDHGLGLPSTRLIVDGIPFDLVTTPDQTNLFLRDAQWPDWQADPSSYYAAYDSVPAARDPRRPFFHIPVADYSCAYLLAATDPDTALSPELTLRLGCFDGPRRTTIHDFAATVPRSTEKQGEGVTRVLPGVGGNVFVIRVPIETSLAQDFRDRPALDLEVTKAVRLAIRRPDPCRFCLRPLGLPSGVRIYAMTFQRAPVQMEVHSGEAGHVFNQPQTPMFSVTLRGVHSVPGRGPFTLEAVAASLDGHVTTATADVTLPLAPEAAVSLPVPVERRGWYALHVRLKRADALLLTRATRFALLAPDTRRHRDTAPWGTWDFCGTHYTPADPDITGPLYVKAGLRYGMFSQSVEARARYGVLRGNDYKAKNADDVRALVARLKDDPTLPRPERIMVFHEDAISGPHITRTPSLFTGGAPYRFDEQEQQRFDTMWQGAREACREIRYRFPEAETYFGNGNVHLLEAFLQRGFPRELLGSRGNEAGNFQRLPEAQPPDFVGNNSGLWMDRQVLDHYGYGDVPLRQCYEICYPSTNPGNLSLRTQAAYYVRHILHSMAWEIPIIRVGCITDVGNSYYFSNWGASGFCFAQPDVSPKPSYVAVATLTQVLDGARFSRVVPCGAPDVYALEFQRPDRGYVTCLWTVRGSRDISVKLQDDGRVTLVDMMGEERSLATSRRTVTVTTSADPVYLISKARVEHIAPGPTRLGGPPEGESFLISALADMGQWSVETARDTELEVYDFTCPRRQGQFEYSIAAEFEGRQHVLEVRPHLPVPGSPYLPMYSALRHATGVELPGEPTEIGLMVNGNGGWGRIIFELEDASGQRWVSLGAEARGEPTRWMADWLPPEQFAALKTSGHNDWNTADPWGRSSISFEGWGYVRFPLPGQYPGEGYHWPYSSQWRYTGDGVVHYPLRFTRLIVTLPEKVLRFREHAPVARSEVYLKDLMVTYLPPEDAFQAP